MTNKNTILLKCIFLFTINLIFACAPNQNKIAKNKFSLQVIGKVKSYALTIQTDSNKQMVLLRRYIPALQTQWIYATRENFTKWILYHKPGAYVRLNMAKALQQVSNELNKIGLGIKIFDAYRPYSITKKMWKIIPDDRYAANPAKGSAHNRGAAIDLTLINVKTGDELRMPTSFDNFTDRAHHDYLQLDEEVIIHRNLLKRVMENYGFIALNTEWWHYYFPNANRFELLDLNFRQLKRINKTKK